MYWVIQYEGAPPFCWIGEASPGAAFNVTFRFGLAERFTCAEDARHESLRLGLSGDWRVRDYRDGGKTA